MIVVAITAAVDASGALNTFYVCDGRFVSSPTDTPSNTFFEGSLMEPGSIGINTFGDGRTGGTTSLESGEVVLDNTDGKYDDWINYSFDGRPITIYSGTEQSAFPSGFVKIFSGTIESVSTDFDKLILKMRDKQFILSTPFLKTKYLGDNIAPNGIEGTPETIKGQVKPRVFGRVNTVPATLVNASKLVYQICANSCVGLRGVQDRGVDYTIGSSRASSAVLLSTTPTAGTVDYCLSEGLLRFGSQPAGQVTAGVDVGGPDTGSTGAGTDQTVAQIVRLMALEAGLSAGEISSADVAAMDILNPSVVGIYINDESSTQECIDKLLGSIGGYCTFDSSGVLRLGVLTEPTGTPVAILEEFDTLEGIERRAPRDNGIPVWRVTLDYGKNWTVQTDLATSVLPNSRAYFSQEYRSTVAEAAAVKTQYLLAGDVKYQTLLAGESRAALEATRLLNMYKVSRGIYDIPISLDLFNSAGLKIMDVIQVNSPRFNLSTKLLKIIGYRLEIKTNTIILQCWG